MKERPQPKPKEPIGKVLHRENRAILWGRQGNGFVMEGRMRGRRPYRRTQEEQTTDSKIAS